MLSNIHHNSVKQSNNFKHHRSNRSSPALTFHNGIHQNLNNDTHHVPTSLPLSSAAIQCSAYFISRQDLNDYTIYTLKQTLDSVVSGPKSKGLKVKLSLPEEGLIIDNIPDSSQSWMYKTSELLYIWRDPYYVNIIVVITKNRSRYHASGPYSASIFRLRGNESIQLFLQRAQQFFAQLAVPNIPTKNTKILLEKSATTESLITTETQNNHNNKSKHHSRTNKLSVIKPFSSSQTKPAHLITRTEFDSEKTTTTTGSVFDLHNRRPYSETRISNSKKLNNNNYDDDDDDDDDDDKITTVSNYLPGEYVVELMHELKELRNEIAALKLDTRFTLARSTSPSPLLVSEGNTKERMTSASSFPKLTPQSEVDAETQTDFSLINHERQSFVETTLVNSSQKNGLSDQITSPYTQEDYPPASFLGRPRSLLKIYQNGSTISNSNSNEKDSSSHLIPEKNEKEIPKVLSTNISSSSIPVDTESSIPIKTGGIVSFRSSLENTIAPSENIYENIPILSQRNSNPTVTNENDKQQTKSYLSVTTADDRNSELEQQYLSQLVGPQNGILLQIPQISNSSATEEIPSNNYQHFQQVRFSDHLTNPLFNVDKQLLANTIANQFGIDPKSPYLQKLIENQQLFVTNKRTFANMIWQITSEEENALCSSPVTTSNIIDTNYTVSSNSATAKSILKSNKSPRFVSKRQRISWDSTLD